MADSNITKRALANALKTLMNEKHFEKISVSDICEKCSMNRKSFYYHFKDKYDLVNWIFDTEFVDYLKVHREEEGFNKISSLCYYFYENRVFYYRALSVEGQNSFSEYFHDLSFSAIAMRLSELFPSEELSDFQINFYADAIVSAIKRWILARNCMPPEEFISQIKECLCFLAERYSELGSPEE
ncbi:MAG: TetR/AcrR family transcriptional regulator C-terminal domain-containing protein [Candidatus Limivicinus sp.]